MKQSIDFGVNINETLSLQELIEKLKPINAKFAQTFRMLN